MAVDGRCEEDVSEPPGYWHSHPCRNKAKHRIRLEVEGKPAREMAVCGVHLRSHGVGKSWSSWRVVKDVP